MVTRVFGKIIENIYDVDDKLVQITDENGDRKDVYKGKPDITKETKVKEWSELCSFQGEARYNKDLGIYYGMTFNRYGRTLNISEDDEVGVEKEIFRADLNEVHLRTDKVVEELDINKDSAECNLSNHIKAFNKMMIESNDKLKTYCDLHKLSYEDTDCIELFKLVFPNRLYIIRDGKMKVSDAMYVSSTALSYPSFTAPLGSIVCNE